MQRISKGEKVKKVYKDYEMAVKIHNASFENDDIKGEYITRLEKGNEKVVDIYNELFNIKPEKKTHEKKMISKAEVEKIVKAVKNNSMSIDEAIRLIQEM